MKSGQAKQRPAKRLMDVSGQETGHGQDPGRRLMEERTRILARSRDHDRHQGPVRQVVLFRLAREGYALELSKIREVLSFRPPAAIPGLPSFYLGMFSHHGELYTLVDLARLMGMDPGTDQIQSTIIIVDHQENHVGFLVESVGQIRAFSEEEITPASTAIPTRLEPFVAGILGNDSILLDAEKLVLSPELAVDHQTVNGNTKR